MTRSCLIYFIYIILYYTTKHFANYGFGHCFGFQYVPSRLPALGILAKILWEDLGCVFTANSDFLSCFCQAHKRHRREKEPVMESEAMPKESKRRKVRCGRETYGKYTKTMNVRLEMDTLLEGKASRYESISKRKRFFQASTFAMVSGSVHSLQGKIETWKMSFLSLKCNLVGSMLTECFTASQLQTSILGQV